MHWGNARLEGNASVVERNTVTTHSPCRISTVGAAGGGRITPSRRGLREPDGKVLPPQQGYPRRRGDGNVIFRQPRMLCSYPPADRYHCPNFDLTPHKKFREVNRAFAQFCGAAWNPAPAPDLRT